MNKGIWLLAGTSTSSNIVYNWLEKRHFLDGVIHEKPQPKSKLIRRRAKRLGWRTVAGQVAFMFNSCAYVEYAFS